MIKYFFLILMTSMMACGDQASGTTTQTPSEPTSSSPSTNASSSAPASPTTSASPVATETPAAPVVSSQTPASPASGGARIPLTGIYWKLIELNGKNIEGKTAKEMYLFLDPSSPQLKSHSGCNLVMGEAKTSGPNKMRFINLLSTTMPCNTPDIDSAFQKAMEEVAEYAINGNNLQLNKKGSVPVMKFVAKR
jgi:heat shock protein HslJ